MPVDAVSRSSGARNAQLSTMFELIDGGDWDSLAHVFHPDLVYERPGYGPLVGRERVLRFYREERLVASGRHELEGIVVDGDEAACWGRMRGVLKDGSRADVGFAEVYRFQDGKVRMRRSYFFRPAV